MLHVSVWVTNPITDTIIDAENQILRLIDCLIYCHKKIRYLESPTSNIITEKQAFIQF